MVYFVDGKIDLVCPVNDTLENVPYSFCIFSTPSFPRRSIQNYQVL